MTLRTLPNRLLAPALWQVRRRAQALGPAGMLGLLLLLSAAMLHLTLMRTAPPLAPSAPAHRVSPAWVSPTAPPASERERLNAFYRAFPGERRLPELSAQLLTLARAENLALDQAEYKLAAVPGTRLLRYEINLPIKGNYLAVRRFVAAGLREIGGLALDGITWVRKKPDDPTVEVQLRLSLYLEAA